MKGILYKVLGIALMAAFAAACAREPENIDNAAGGTVDLNMQVAGMNATRAVNDGVDLDERVATVRVMMFVQGTGLIERNSVHSLADGGGADIFQQRTYPGTYTVVFVANETSSIASDLDAVGQLSDLDAIRMAAADFNDNTPIPMYARYDGVVVSKSGTAAKVSVGGSDYVSPTPWPVSLTRIAAKLSLTLKHGDDVSGRFEGITITNLPTDVPLVPGQTNNTATGTRTYDDDGFTLDYDTDILQWSAVNPRIILPSKYFTGGALADAVKVTVNMNSGNSPSGYICVNPSGGDYTMPRNNVFGITVLLEPFEVEVTYEPWTETVDTDVDLLGRKLNVSDLDKLLISWVPTLSTRLYFNTNKWLTASQIFVEDKVTRVSDNTQQDFSDIFETVAFNYNSTSGDGYVDLRMKQGGTGNANNDYRIVLNSNGLKRSVTVKADNYYVPELDIFVGVDDSNPDGSPRAATGGPQGWASAMGYASSYMPAVSDVNTGNMTIDNTVQNIYNSWIGVPPYGSGSFKPTLQPNAATGCGMYDDPIRGTGGWRVPTMQELAAIYFNMDRCSREETLFESGTGAYYLTSTESASNQIYTMGVRSPGEGVVTPYLKTTVSGYVRCIKAGTGTSSQYGLDFSAGSQTASNMPASSTHAYAEKVTLPGTVPTTTTGQLFSHWNTRSDGKGMSYGPGDTFTMPAGDVTLYAVWFNPKTLTLTQLPYVGTFHRWDQIGERLINMPYSATDNAGYWEATVLKGHDFIKLSTAPSSDPKVYTTTAADMHLAFNDKTYTVEGNSTLATGTATSSSQKIFFRVGMKSKLASATSAPRYGLILVRYADLTKYHLIYVRQGEEPDVINGTEKWTAQNLSDPLRGTGGPNISYMSKYELPATLCATSFADFPSQAGYMFRWNTYSDDAREADTNYVLHPSNPGVDVVIVDHPSYWASKWDPAKDPCPTGYHTPTRTENESLASASNAWGFYADGSFDRYVLVASNTSTGTGNINWKVSYRGRLFYNPDTYASIFMPAVGVRLGTKTVNKLANPGLWGCYHSSDVRDPALTASNVYVLRFTSTEVVPDYNTFDRQRAMSTRCIKNN